MFRSRVIGSILKRNKAQLNSISSNLKETASRGVISCSSSSSSSTVARSSLYGFRSLLKVPHFFFNSVFLYEDSISLSGMFSTYHFDWSVERPLTLMKADVLHFLVYFYCKMGERIVYVVIAAFAHLQAIYMGNYTPSVRNMSMAASVGMENKAGLKLLVPGGPHAQKMVGIWLFGSAAWVFSMVVLGGVTRLTRSGLSMTDWKFTGSLPPLSNEEWLREFEKYKQSPEYKRVNKGMSIEDFKFIYWMEYAHRMWGRGLGIIFALPFSYFLRKGYITLRLGLRLSALFALGAGQGFIGWWMVKSGLEEPPSEYAQPRVSPYRLAAHLTSAFVIYSGLFWTGLSVVMPEPPAESVAWVRGAAKVKKLAIPVSFIVGITAISGAFVAGNDAGRAYNTFPKMGDKWIPDDIFDMKPLIRNFFENTSTVQLDHRILATTTLFSIGALWLATRKLDIHPAIRSLIGSTVGMAALQVTLGISTLLSYVPVSLGSAHQAGALTLLTLMILLNHTVRKPSTSLLKSLPQVAKTIY
ncbi:hypothetical protein JRO89_XS15G0115700 [Xanthoceras sorbifolium]|uniref:Cytochrome c oxidase assembly protein COX15 n=1 Tax=Xanthoceras sorbifolium TaxID=99658 RepID=A0ABQ8H1Q4_9ROSI|nr:hypothetical protein JRO89_XS15G0115700 [Xanthoceras sorbifolium]